MKKLLALVLLAAAPCLPASALRAVELPPELKIHASGAFERGGVTVGIVHFERDWKGYRHQREVSKPLPTYPRLTAGTWDLQARFHNLFDLSQRLIPAGPGMVRYEARVHAAAPVETSTLALEVYLPAEAFAGQTVLIDNQPFLLPPAHERVRLYERTPVQSLVIQTPEGPLGFSGSFSLYIQDNRQFRTKPGFVAQLRFTPHDGPLQDAAFDTVIYVK